MSLKGVPGVIDEFLLIVYYLLWCMIMKIALRRPLEKPVSTDYYAVFS